MTEQTDRDRIVAALYDSRRRGLGGMSEAQAVCHMADAVLAALAAAVPAGHAPATDGDPAAPELTAQEARDLADELGTELYRAQDALAFVEECCVIADRTGRQPTTADVREWLKGARCGRQLLADAQDQTALRDRIAEALYEHTHPGSYWSDTSMPDDWRPTYLEEADAVLSVLPTSVDRAAVYAEVAEMVRCMAPEHPTNASWVQDCHHIADRIDEAVVVRRATDETPDEVEVQLPFIHVDDDGDQLDIGAVMASTYDGEAPVVYVAAEQHQGDTVATVYVRPERVDEVIAALRSARLAAEALPAVGAQQPKEADGPRTVCVCGHTRGEHAVVGGRLLCDECVPDSTDNLVCKEFEAL